MKTYIFITVWAATLAVAIFFGLSNLNIQQTQYQTQTQNQIQSQENTQLTYVDLNKKATNVYWELKVFEKEKEFEIFFNKLTYLQQKESKFAARYHGNYSILYPEYNREILVYTNNNVSVNSNINRTTLSFLGKKKK